LFSACVGGQGDKHTSVGDGRENGDMAAGKTLLSLIPQRILLRGVDPRYPRLLLPNLSKVEKVVFTLDMVRRRELFEYNTRIHHTLPTRFCEYNIAFFDLDKECEYILSMSYSLHLVSFLSGCMHIQAAVAYAYVWLFV